MKNLQYFRGLIVGPFFVSAKLISLAVFLSFSLAGGYMSAETVFVTIGLYHATRLATTLFMPFALTFMMETKVTLDRIQVSSGVDLWSVVFLSFVVHKLFFAL